MNYFEYLGIKIYLGDFKPVHWLFFHGNEFWKNIPDYEGLYEASTLGRIKSIKRNGCNGGMISSQITRGYLSIKLCKNNKPTRITIHKIIAATFLIKPVFYECINHKDGKKQNNRPKNLEYTTNLLNIRHAIETGLCANRSAKLSKFRTGMNGLLNGRTKAILQCDIITGEIIKEHISATYAHLETGINRQNISQCCVGTKRSAGGYFWKHKT